MSGYFFGQAQASPCLLLKRARRVGHVQPTTTIADRQTVTEHVLAKLDGHLGIERLHESITKDIAGNDVGVTRAEDQIAIGVNSRPVKRHEATLVAKCIEIVGKVLFIILSTQLAWRRNYKGG